MRKLPILPCVFVLLFPFMAANAAFLANHKYCAPAYSVSLVGTDTAPITYDSNGGQAMNVANNTGRVSHPDGGQNTKPDTLKSGWEGIVALCCLITGFLVPAAIVFGAFGMQPGRKRRGMAKVAFVLGIVVAAVAAVVFFVVAAGH